MITVREFEPGVGLCADSSEPGACFEFCVCVCVCVCLSLSLPFHPHALSLSKINIKKEKFHFMKKFVLRNIHGPTTVEIAKGTGQCLCLMSRGELPQEVVV